MGAVRQESFAGRPSDIDFGIKEEQLQKLLDAIPLLIKGGAKTIKTETYPGEPKWCKPLPNLQLLHLVNLNAKLRFKRKTCVARRVEIVQP